MPFVETLIITVGGAVAKSILKHWLKDDSLSFATTEGLLEIFKSKTPDVLAQRRARRQFEDIGERVAVSLLAVFERDGDALDDGARQSIAETLAATLEAAVLSSNLLIEQELNSDKFGAYLITLSKESETGYSQEEVLFLHLLLRETGKSIIEIGSSLPQFQENTFAELFKRDNELLEVAEKILETLTRLQDEIRSPAGPEELARQFEVSYLGEITRVLNRIEIYGVDLLSAASREQNLTTAYITLSAKRQPLQNAEGAPKTDPEEASFDTLLQNQNRLLIRGSAGSGKTTLLQWLAVGSATKRFATPLIDWNDCVPFFIQLRKYEKQELPPPEAFPSLVAPLIAGTMPEQWVHKRLHEGRATILVDSFDEVSDIRRKAVQRWLEGLIALFGKCRFVVTARPYAADADWFDRHGFAQAELLPMSDADIATFIDYWHRAVSEEVTTSREKAELPDFAANLKTVIQEQSAIRSLATNPLLCAMLCALHRDRFRKIPEDQIELYQSCCDMLMSRRDNEREVQAQGYPSLNVRQKQLVLQDIAYWMLREGYPTVSFAETEEYIAPTVSRLNGLGAEADSSGVLRLFVERVGMLREPGTGQLEFSHPIFRDFLAAKAAIDADHIEILIENAHLNQWRDVVLLAVGLAKGEKSEYIITRLIEQGDADVDLRPLLHSLAGACTLMATVLSAETAEAVKLRLAVIAPVEITPL